MGESSRIMTIEIHNNGEERYAISYQSWKQHKLIFGAFRQKHPESAYKLMYEHVAEIQGAPKKAMPGK
jgi:DNA-binding GntR family transcriptional regulator